MALKRKRKSHEGRKYCSFGIPNPEGHERGFIINARRLDQKPMTIKINLEQMASLDAWILLSTWAATREDAADLKDIVAVGDAINHSVFTVEELKAGLRRLGKDSYIFREENHARITRKTKYLAAKYLVRRERRTSPVGGRYPTRQLTLQPETTEASARAIGGMKPLVEKIA